VINQLRLFLWDDPHVQMSCYLWDEMIVAALVETNNMYQFAKFANGHFNIWQTTLKDPVELRSTFIDSFQIWLQTNYMSNKGNHLRNNEKKGTVHFMCCKNTPTLVVTSHNNVRVFHDKMKPIPMFF
jgi:hypothetical protein